MTCELEKRQEDTPTFLMSSFINVILWISMWGIVFFGIEIISKRNKNLEISIYIFMLLSILLIRCYFPHLMKY
uniref:Uncharacterized protein n=1 Tax=viral metagenome TaxID=1070528 RepID=A0A6C0BIX7_9ZZZZ